MLKNSPPMGPQVWGREAGCTVIKMNNLHSVMIANSRPPCVLASVRQEPEIGVPPQISGPLTTLSITPDSHHFCGAAAY